MRGRLIRWVLPLLLLSVGGVGAAMAATSSMHAAHATVNAAKSSSFGMVLVARNGRTLYRYTVDKKGVNRCNAVALCAKNWPDLLVKPGAKPTAGGGAKATLLGTIKAPHGMRQVTYAGFPLYYFAGDKKAGEANGQGIGKVWFVVSTKGALVKRGAAPAPAPATTGGGTTTSSSGGGGGAWG